MAFATFDELESFVRQDVDTFAAEALLELASAAVISAAEVPILEVVDDEVDLDGNGATTLLLPSYPVTDVTAVSVGGDAVDGFSWSRAGVLVGAWPTGRRNVAVTYSHGYAADSIPAEFKLVTLNVAARAWLNPGGLSQETLGDLSRSFQTSAGMALSPAERDIVARALR